MLTELGLYRLWGEDPERTWQFARWFLPAVHRVLSPSFGYGVERMPERGGAVLAANHFSGLDPTFIGIYSRRTIYYMTKYELLATPVVGEILRWMGAFAVRRGESDRDALRMARWTIANGHVVGMFMEGTRQRFGYPGPVHPGAAMLAMKEGVPVIPCGVDTFRWSLRNPRRCCVVFGEPIDLAELPHNGRGYKEGARTIETAIFRLWRQAAQAIVDGFPERLPDGSKRHSALRVSEGARIRGAAPWPGEPWARGPLGPVWRERRR